MEALGKLMEGDSIFSSPLVVAFWGACVLLGSCFLPALIWHGRTAGTRCRPDEPFEGDARGKATVTSLYVYSVKSCAGQKVPQVTLGDRGFEMDRLWLVVDGNGRFMSQRKCPKMALIKPSLPKSHDEPLVMSAPGMASLEVPVMRKVGPGGPSAGGSMVKVVIWRDTCEAVDQGDAIAAWLCTFLELENLRLVRMRDGFVRPTDPSYGKGFRTSFADGFPMLLAAEESLEELNSRMATEDAVGMDRFRPNIVVRGWGPFAEDDWTKIIVGGIVMRTPKPCDRCQIPTINQSTLETCSEPRATLAKFRTGSQVAAWNESWAKRLYFGVNVLHEQRGVLRVGDGVDVLRVAKKMPLDAKKTD